MGEVLPSGAARARGKSRVGLSFVVVLPFAFSLFAYGGVHPGIRALLGGLVAMVVLLVTTRPSGRPGLGRLGLVSLGTAALVWVLSALALVPVGPGLRAFFQPGLAELIGRSLSQADTTVHPLAIAPNRFLVGWGSAGAAIGLAGAVALHAHTRSRLRRIASLVVGMAGLFVLLALVQRWMGASHILWLGTVPEQAREPFFGTFVNPNHAGALLAACLPLAVMLAMASDTTNRVVGSSGALVLAVGLWMTHSRGALLEASAGLIVMALVIGGRTVRVGMVAVVGLLLGTAIGSGRDRWLEWLGTLMGTTHSGPNSDGERPQMWLEAFDLISASPFVGVGHGGFVDAFKTVKMLPHYSLSAHAHQEPLQALIEHGLVLGLMWWVVVLLPVVAALRVGLYTQSSRKRLTVSGFLGAAVALGLAGQFGFPLRVGALWCLAALVWGGLISLSVLSTDQVARRVRPVVRWTVCGLGLAGLVVGGAWTTTRMAPDSVFAATSFALAEVDSAHEADDQEREKTWALAAVRARPLDQNGLLRLARAQRSAGQIDEAVKTVALATEVYPSLPWVWLAQVQMMRDRDVTAERAAWKRLLTLNLPENDSGERYVRAALLSGSDPVEAAQQAIPDRADRLRDAGRILATEGGPAARETAESMLARAAELDARMNLPYANQLLRWGQAEQAWKMVQKVPNRHCGTLKVGGRALVALENGPTAVDWFERAMSICGSDDEQVRLGLGQARALNGDPDAIPLLETAVKARPAALGVRRALLRALARHQRYQQMIPHLEELVLDGAATPREAEDLTRILAGLPPGHWSAVRGKQSGDSVGGDRQ